MHRECTITPTMNAWPVVRIGEGVSRRSGFASAVGPPEPRRSVLIVGAALPFQELSIESFDVLV